MKMNIDRDFQKEHRFSVNCPNCNVEQVPINVPLVKLPDRALELILTKQLKYQVLQCPKCKIKALQIWEKEA